MTSGQEPDDIFRFMESVQAAQQAMDAEARALRALLKTVESAETATRSLTEFAKQLQAPLKLFEQVDAATRAAVERDRQLQELTRAANADRRYVADLLTNLSKFVERESVQKLMQHGWFPDLDLTAPQIEQLAEAFDDHPEQANEFLCQRFRDRLEDTEAKVKTAFPKRAEILRQAFHAHRQGHYYLSVTAFLPQVDGFFYDRWSKSLFMGRHWEDIESETGQMQNELAREMVRVLLDNDWPLIMNWKQRQQEPDGWSHLNRHQVLHGEVVDYGTEENSLKAISLLNYCATVLPEPADDNGCE